MREWATRALQESRDARSYVQMDGPTVTLGGPAARRLLGGGESPEAATAAAAIADLLHHRGLAPVKLVDTFGFSRPVYYPLLVHLQLLTAADKAVPQALRAAAARDVPTLAAQDPSMRLWWAVCLYEAATALADDSLRQTATALAEPIAANPGAEGALHPREGLDDLLDAWTFRELAGLHALGWLAIHTGNERWWERVRQVASAHQAITQPDYTTYQPWGVHAFLMWGETIPFGEQQLHDAVTNLHVERGGAGLVPGLLLADAAAALEAAAR